MINGAIKRYHMTFEHQYANTENKQIASHNTGHNRKWNEMKRSRKVNQPWRQTLEILWVCRVMAPPVLAVGDTVQVPGSGQQGLVPWWCNICHLILVLLLVSFPNVDNCVWFQLHSRHTYSIRISRRGRKKKRKEGEKSVQLSSWSSFTKDKTQSPPPAPACWFIWTQYIQD